MFRGIIYGICFTVFISAAIIIMGNISGSIDMYGKLPIKASYKDLSKDAQAQVNCLADNIYFEAAHEPYAGKKAVGFVTINRLQTGNYSTDICGVVHQRTETVCQFSWYCDKDITSKRLTIKHTKVYNDIRELATHLFLNFDILEDVTEGSTYYHADYVNPNWKLQKVNQIGRHIFYRSGKDTINRRTGIN